MIMAPPHSLGQAGTVTHNAFLYCIKWRELCKVVVVLFLATLYDVDEVGRQHKRDTFSFNTEFTLEMAENVTKVNVEHLQQK